MGQGALSSNSPEPAVADFSGGGVVFANDVTVDVPVVVVVVVGVAVFVVDVVDVVVVVVDIITFSFLATVMREVAESCPARLLAVQE
jgi:hypothetical protein